MRMIFMYAKQIIKLNSPLKYFLTMQVLICLLQAPPVCPTLRALLLGFPPQSHCRFLSEHTHTILWAEKQRINMNTMHKYSTDIKHKKSNLLLCKWKLTNKSSQSPSYKDHSWGKFYLKYFFPLIKYYQKYMLVLNMRVVIFRHMILAYVNNDQIPMGEWIVM